MSDGLDATKVMLLFLAGYAGWLGYALWLSLRAWRRRRELRAGEVVYEERHASGCSQEHLLSRAGGSAWVLRLKVTRRALCVAPPFPLSIVGALLDLDHVIPLEDIVALRRKKVPGGRALMLTYRDEQGEWYTLKLFPMKPEDFARSLGREPTDEAVDGPE